MSLPTTQHDIQHLPTSGNVRDVLARICDAYNLGSVTDLLKIMETTHTVISGSWALCAIFPDAFTPGDLDLYTSDPKKHVVTPLIRFLISRGYAIESLADEEYTAAEIDLEAADIGNIMKLTKKRPRINDTHRHINVITSRSPYQIRPIFRFHSTVVMNFIGSYGLVSLYPELTLHRRGLINDPAPTSHVKECVSKYRRRGFDMRSNLDEWDNTHVCSHSPDCSFKNRRLLDDSVLFVPFEEGRALSDCIEDNRCILRVPCYSS